ncbi:hypothetical protein ACET3Z_032241 [Daucus carota]
MNWWWLIIVNYLKKSTLDTKFYLEMARVAGQGRSKWLLDENDADWEAKIGRENSGAFFTGENQAGKDKGVIVKRDLRLTDSDRITIAGTSGKKSGVISNKIVQIRDEEYGPEEEENHGLEIEDQKRRRSGPETKSIMDTDDTLRNIVGLNNRSDNNKETDLSDLDCSVSADTILAQLAQQVSQSQ